MNFPTLETARLRLQAFQEQHLEVFAQYRSHPQVAQYQAWDAPYSIQQAYQFFHELQTIQPGKIGEWYQVAITLKSNTQIIGDCAFCILAEDPQQAEIGCTLAPNYQNQGYAFEALHQLIDYLFLAYQLHRIRAICHVENYPSQRLLTKLGMRQEAKFIEAVWFKGQWVSEYWYAILKHEWKVRV